MRGVRNTTIPESVSAVTPRSKKLKPAGVRIGTKRGDMRYRAHGIDWASKLEADVYGALKGQAEAGGSEVRKCISGRDTVPYQTSVRGGVCGDCKSRRIHQEHTYTPDLYTRGAWPGAGSSEAVLEVKGYLRPKDKRILRAVHASGVLPNLCLLLAREHAATVTWARKFLKGMPVGVFMKDHIKVIL